MFGRQLLLHHFADLVFTLGRAAGGGGTSRFIRSKSFLSRATTSGCISATFCCSAGSSRRIEQRHGGRGVSRAHTRIIGRLILFVRRENRHAIGTSRIDPPLT